MTPAARAAAGRPRPWWFLAAVVGWTWAFLWPATLTGQPWLAYPTVLLTIAGMLGPLVVTAGFVAAGWWHAPPRAFWRRALDPRSVAPRRYVIALSLAVVLAGAPLVWTALTRGAAPWSLVAGSGPVTFLLVGLLAGIVEEPAWRGYAQNALQRRLPAAGAALVVGVFWALWHLPLFYLEGT
ncbi:MAG: CPBP family intramembrane metalloprotease [Trueperaceae bacterium]|nr:CPBP family intramembrane metalloprotease [Trueperaceae bacterium]